ncbi:siderophore-interacting protein [Streptomyces oceani]|uniref:Sialic acid transporter n=1 Tax=Streptomyces oceani TaxID=1075402 RepID=A0A1E7KGU1_9ACTN|nr:siderophore-interacting protein [Streptomyces oceani]OEV03086.1 sialic acid transporter [Streptomyces oceani]
MSIAAPEAPALPFAFFELSVVRSRLVSPSMMRVTLGGARLSDFVSGGRDQRVKLFLPHPHQSAPVVPTECGADWFPAWRAMDAGERAVMRSYTVRELRREPDELDIDFVLHGLDSESAGSAGGIRSAAGTTCAAGPAARWAAHARPGDRVTVFAPTVRDNAAVDFRPPDGTDWVLLSADETALPAVAGILDWLPAGTPVKALLEVPHAADKQPLPSAANTDVTWLVRDEAPTGVARGQVALDALRAAELPAGARPYAWIAGEAGTVKTLRRHLVQERGFDRKAVKFTGYWRLGSAEEQLVEEAVAGNPVNPVNEGD